MKMPHTPEPWYLRVFPSESFPFAICTNDPPDDPGDNDFHIIALIARECRLKPIETTRKEIHANGELLVRSPRMARSLVNMLAAFHEVIPGIAHIACQDYAIVNSAPAEAAALIAELKKAGVL